jgi:SAM-dependent methyltransferase
MSYDNRDYWTRLHSDTAGHLTVVGYPEMGEGFNEETYKLRLSAVRRILARTRFSGSAGILEGAVGVGAYSNLWKEMGFSRWTGIDISQHAVEQLQAEFPQHAFIALDLAASGQRGWEVVEQRGPYDLVTAIDVLYHLVSNGDFETALRNLARLVRPGGSLLVSDVFPASVVDVAEHVRRRPLASYLSVLAPLGFQLRDREPVFAILGDPVRRTPFNVRDNGLLFTWRILSKSIRVLPPSMRIRAGRTAARSLQPIDALLRRLGWSRGTNLELALFQQLAAA